MEIYKEEFYKIFQNNFDYEIVETELGTAIKMPAHDAFIFSHITGAGYLENPIYQFSTKGLMKLFYNAFQYKFVTGIFDNSTLKNTPYIFSKAKPYIFKGDKYIIPFEIESERDFQSEMTIKFKKIKNPEKYIIFKIETSKKGNGMESFMEYLTAEYFKNKNYVVETQIPLAHSIGSPDFGGYRIKDFFKILYDNGLFSSGFHVIELSLLRIFNNKKKYKILDDDSLIVGEAKTSTTQMQKQLEKYLNTDLFSSGYEIHPSKRTPAKRYFGLITLDKNYKIKNLEPEKAYIPTKPLNRDNYVLWLKNYFKYYLIANFSNDELLLFSKEKTGKIYNNKEELSNFINKLNVEDIIQKILTL
ncbi:MAG: hypothetical protein A2493_02105 [Candidatus Magasanikbacteria bacterium RIFOXYC12_FULL_33_11]|uniref:Uncharacterized protein n=1 Tax=Candidatus Magasanikbacteria bacterium RIFOXYC12_FULL_33_11 TaxID=1798701 RepID=A0A1F6NP05_9BACT|nr:MAG: hypothetical protein A2493_02105 [Candidatus Magasanikbacteria bacterium RIFOXYC12_FULL_33_11]